MRWNGEFWEGNISASTGPANTLTAGKLLDMMRKFECEFPPLPSTKFDLFGSDLVDAALELTLPDELQLPGTKGWRTLIVPKVKLDWWAYELRRHGADVRVEPRLPERRSGDA